MRSFYFEQTIPKQRQGDKNKRGHCVQWSIQELQDQLGNNACLCVGDPIFKHVLEEMCLKKDLLDLEEKRNYMSDWIKKVIISAIVPFPRDRKHGQEMAALIAWEGK